VAIGSAHNTKAKRQTKTTTVNKRAYPAQSARGASNRSEVWRPLTLLNLYRLGISLIFLSAISAGFAPRTLGAHDKSLFWLVCVVYVVMAIVFNFSIQLRKPAFSVQVHMHLWIDIAAILLFTHASGGIDSGLGMLLIPIIAGGSLLLSERVALFYAAVCSLALLGLEAYAQWLKLFEQTQYTQAGLLGGSLFVTSIIAVALARRARQSQELAEQRGIDIANLEAINAYIVDRLDSGLIVIDQEQRIRFINPAARKMLVVDKDHADSKLTDISPLLAGTTANWLDKPFGTLPTLQLPGGGEALLRFNRIGRDEETGVIINLDDAKRMTQQVQQMKLASLGRLTASIAHEIRNPLGAIDHAAQLLNEAEQQDAADQRLTEIIRTNSVRVNEIVESIMQISRSEAANPEAIDVESWLNEFLADFIKQENMDPRLANLEIKQRLGRVYADRTQLQQVLWNLCQNVLHHCARPSFRIEAAVHPEHETPYIDVIDRGPKIPEETANQLFEPFYTTKSRGTGLGLYVARELSQRNEADLSLEPDAGPGNRFRLSFNRGAR
jgi:two-component system sensor histidine kinase PilS (NtrC family)